MTNQSGEIAESFFTVLHSSSCNLLFRGLLSKEELAKVEHVLKVTDIRDRIFEVSSIIYMYLKGIHSRF